MVGAQSMRNHLFRIIPMPSDCQGYRDVPPDSQPTGGGTRWDLISEAFVHTHVNMVPSLVKKTLTCLNFTSLLSFPIHRFPAENHGLQLRGADPHPSRFILIFKKQRCNPQRLELQPLPSPPWLRLEIHENHKQHRCLNSRIQTICGRGLKSVVSPDALKSAIRDGSASLAVRLTMADVLPPHILLHFIKMSCHDKLCKNSYQLPAVEELTAQVLGRQTVFIFCRNMR